MKIVDALRRIRTVEIEDGASAVCETSARRVAAHVGAWVVRVPPGAGASDPGVFRVSVLASGNGTPAVRLRLGDDGSGHVTSTDARFLYHATCYLLDVMADREVSDVAGGLTMTPAFDWNRSCYDVFLTQEARTQHGLDRDTYVRRLAESGFTHIEVNGLAFPMGLETGPKGEVYPMFYTYCPALDQFVHSSLNKGLYPFYYLSQNLDFLKRNADLARKYGLVPGLLSFEPRSVPEEFFARYPMLRGARVDHPFRSFKPRYTMTLAHPIVREHYAEMLTRLMHEVPELGFIDIWTNDSGAGFEHTRSLYVGRNGGPYMIREWKDHEEIARVAGEHALRFFGVLREAGRAVNPAFKVITRLESFMGEHETLWRGLGEGLDVETTSLVARGWDMPYTHPRYPDSKSINGGSVYQLQFAEGERASMADLTARGSAAHFYFSAGPHQMFAPLMGVPYPTLTWRRLKMLWDGGVRTLAEVGGTFPPELAPFNANHEILRRFQLDPGMDVEVAVQELARGWAGDRFAGTLAEAWRLAEEAILAFPNVCTLYSTIGFTWYRLWVRPFVPNIEAIPPAERAYYEEFMCTTPHNPNNVDLSRDVLFHLATPERCALDVQRMDANVWTPLDRAIELLEQASAAARGLLDDRNVIADHLVRLRALRCWLITQRNLAQWVASVYGWMGSVDEETRAAHRTALRQSMDLEIANSCALIDLLGSGVEFMATTDLGETPLMHGRNLETLLRKRVSLMWRHIGDDPYIDHDYMMRMSGQMLE